MNTDRKQKKSHPSSNRHEFRTQQQHKENKKQATKRENERITFTFTHISERYKQQKK